MDAIRKEWTHRITYRLDEQYRNKQSDDDTEDHQRYFQRSTAAGATILIFAQARVGVAQVRGLTASTMIERWRLSLLQMLVLGIIKHRIAGGWRVAGGQGHLAIGRRIRWHGAGWA